MTHFAVVARRRAALRVGGRRRQGGAVLFISLIVLVVMLLVGVSMIRKTTTGSVIAGNLAFKQNATSVSDLGVEAARAWIISNAGLLNADSPLNGYFSSWPTSVDPAQFWSGATTTDCATAIPNVVTVICNDGTDNQVSYVIHRLCQLPNMAPNDVSQHCVSEPDATAGSTKTGIDYGSAPGSAATGLPYYRVTTRVVGPRNTLSYTQMVMY